MPISADLIKLGIKEETTYGTAATGSYDALPLTSESMVATPETSQSALLGAGREVQDSILVNLTAGGGMSAELVMCPAFQLLLKSAISVKTLTTGAGASGEPKVLSKDKIGTDLVSFTFERTVPDGSAGASPGDTVRQYVTGCVVNSLTITVSPEGPITWSAEIIGKDYVTSATGVGGSYTAPSSMNVLRGVDVSQLTLFGVDFSNQCFGDFSISINNNIRGIKCIGTKGNKHVVLGTCAIEASAVIHFQDNTKLDDLLNQTEGELIFAVGGPYGTTTGDLSLLRLDLPRVKFTGDEVVAGGQGTDVVDALSMTALKGLTAPKDTTMITEYGTGAPTP